VPTGSAAEADGVILGLRAGHSGSYPRRPIGATKETNSPYDSEDSRAPPPGPASIADDRLSNSSEIGAVFAAELGMDGSFLGDDEWEELLAGVRDVELDPEFPWDQLDWVAAPADWTLRGLAGTIPVTVLETVERARPQAARRPLKFLIETEGKRFTVKINRAGGVTIFPPLEVKGGCEAAFLPPTIFEFLGTETYGKKPPS